MKNAQQSSFEFVVQPRGGHPAQVIGKKITTDSWVPWEGEEGGWVNVETGEWATERPKREHHLSDGGETVKSAQQLSFEFAAKK